MLLFQVQTDLVEIISQRELLEVARGCRCCPDGLPELMLAAPKVERADSWQEVVVPENVGLQSAPVDNGAHCCHLKGK